MPNNTIKSPLDYIIPLNINGLDGRMLKVPAQSKSKNKREILLIYGHHAMLERWWGLIENLNEYGTVTMPDLPGFGGMDSFYKIGLRPDTDTFADYMASFIKLRFRRKRITIVAVSYGFVVVTRMLQRYPELAKKVDLLISIVGFVHKEDFIYSPAKRRLFRRATRLFATRPFAVIIRYLGLNRFTLRTLYVRLPNSKRRMIEVTPEEFEATIKFEYTLWHKNDIRTHWITTSQFFSLDNCKVKVDLPVVHVVSKEDHYFNNEVVKQHMLVTFKSYKSYVALSKAHTPSILADKKAMSVLLPPGVKRLLATKVK
jgi:pimeloyl-ACP methyl ester carboxylesterase